MMPATGDVADEIEIKFLVDCRADRIGGGAKEQRISVRRGTHDRLGADIAAGTRPVLDEELLTKPLRQPLPD